ncbi:unnamed protein product [Closterium sp. Yama58-4]|nr:unnamed protein product [Closterium sp. Yama58-4]
MPLAQKFRRITVMKAKCEWEAKSPSFLHETRHRRFVVLKNAASMLALQPISVREIWFRPPNPQDLHDPSTTGHWSHLPSASATAGVRLAPEHPRFQREPSLYRLGDSQPATSTGRATAGRETHATSTFQTAAACDPAVVARGLPALHREAAGEEARSRESMIAVVMAAAAAAAAASSASGSNTAAAVAAGAAAGFAAANAVDAGFSPGRSLLSAQQYGAALGNATVIPASLSLAPSTQLNRPSAPAPAAASPAPAPPASASALSAALSGQALIGVQRAMLLAAAAAAVSGHHNAVPHRTVSSDPAAAVTTAVQPTASRPAPSLANSSATTTAAPSAGAARTVTVGSGGSRAAVCNEEGGMAPRVSKLLAKWLRSDDEGPHVCPVCKQSFPTAGGLKQHQHDRWRCSLGSQPVQASAPAAAVAAAAVAGPSRAASGAAGASVAAGRSGRSGVSTNAGDGSRNTVRRESDKRGSGKGGDGKGTTATVRDSTGMLWPRLSVLDSAASGGEAMKKDVSRKAKSRGKGASEVGEPRSLERRSQTTGSKRPQSEIVSGGSFMEHPVRQSVGQQSEKQQTERVSASATPFTRQISMINTSPPHRTSLSAPSAASPSLAHSFSLPSHRSEVTAGLQGTDGAQGDLRVHGQQHFRRTNPIADEKLLSPPKRIRSGTGRREDSGENINMADGNRLRSGGLQFHQSREFDLAKHGVQGGEGQKGGMADENLAGDESVHGGAAASAETASAGVADVTAMAGWLRAARVRSGEQWGPPPSGFPAAGGLHGGLEVPARAAGGMENGGRGGGGEERVCRGEEAAAYAVDMQRWHKTQRSRVEILDGNQPPWQAADLSLSGALPAQAERGFGATAAGEQGSRGAGSSTRATFSKAAAAAASAGAGGESHGVSERAGAGLTFDLNMAHGGDEAEVTVRGREQQQTPQQGGVVRAEEPKANIWSRAEASGSTGAGTAGAGAAGAGAAGAGAPTMSIPESCCSWNCVFFSLPCRRKTRLQMTCSQAGERGESEQKESE